MTCATQDFTIKRGETFSRILRWESAPFVTKPITAITKAAPPVVTAVAHSVPDGWRVAIVSVQGMIEINAENWPPKAADFHKATVLTGDTLSLKDINAADYTAYLSGGYVVYYTPVSLAGPFTARMHIREAVASETFILELTTENGRIVLDDALKTITLLLPAAVTALVEEDTGVYDLEMVSAAGVVTRLLEGNVVFTDEVTR